MADDPLVVTGQLSPEQLTRVLRGMPGGNVTEETHFDFAWHAKLISVVAEGRVTIRLEIKGKDEDAEITHYELAPMPLAYFGSPQSLNTFLDDLKRNYTATLRAVLAHEAGLLLRDIQLALCYLSGLEPGGRADVIRLHTEAAGDRLRELLSNLPEHRPPGPWTAYTLALAVRRAVVQLYQRGVRGRALNLDAVNAELRAIYNLDAPASGEALRKQLAERDLNWRQLKAESLEIARIVFSAPETGGSPP